MISRLNRRVVLLGLAATSVTVWADVPVGSSRFTLEWLAFRQPGTHPPLNPPGPIAEVLTLPGRVTLLTSTANQMTHTAAALSRQGYEVLAHLAWAAVIPPNGRTTAALRDLLPPEAPLSGAIAIQRGQHLFMGVDVDYQSAHGVRYGIREHRRIKFNEHHYFDHPAFGMILQVRPPSNEVITDE